MTRRKRKPLGSSGMGESSLGKIRRRRSWGKKSMRLDSCLGDSKLGQTRRRRGRAKGWGGVMSKIGSMAFSSRLGKSQLNQSKGWGGSGRGRRGKLGRVIRKGFASIFRSGRRGRRGGLGKVARAGFGSIFTGKRSVFGSTKLKRGLGAGTRPDRGMGFIRSYGGSAFGGGGGIFGTILGGGGPSRGWGLGLDLRTGISGISPPGSATDTSLAATEAEKNAVEVYNTIRWYVRARLERNHTGYRDARHKLQDLLGKEQADRILEMVNGQRRIPDRLHVEPSWTPHHKLAIKETRLREVVIWAYNMLREERPVLRSDEEWARYIHSEVGVGADLEEAEREYRTLQEVLAGDEIDERAGLAEARREYETLLETI